jgi:hypothetical protein
MNQHVVLVRVHDGVHDGAVQVSFIVVHVNDAPPEFVGCALTVNIDDNNDNTI